MSAFRKGLTELGYVEGKNLRTEYRYATLDREYDSVMEALVSGKVDLIVASNAPAATAAAKATRTIPIVLAGVNDPVGLGVVDSLEHPGRNVTGTTIYAPELIAERLRILRQIVPEIERVAILANGNNKNNPAQVALLADAGKKVGIVVRPAAIWSPEDLAPAVDEAILGGAQGFFNCVDSFINSQRFAIAKLMVQKRRPMIYTDREYVLAGGLMALGVGHTEGFRLAAVYVHTVLNGANPANLPITRLSERAFSVSRSALDNLGIALPKDIADQVTEWLP
jgi:putative ABC transport system substrate-binding protein